MQVNINPLYEFEPELDCIQSDMVTELTMRALKLVPDYFWVVPASSSGKYHPKSSLGIGGLVRHVKAVFWISEELLAHRLYAPFDDLTKDEIRAACLLHDCMKQGTENDGSHTVTEHPLLVREHLAPWRDNNPITEEMQLCWERICDLIETHMGIWNTDREGNEVLQIPETQAQLFVHMCDYLASRRIIEVDTIKPRAQHNYGSKSKTWKDDPATEGQVTYIKKLYTMCIQRGMVHLVQPIRAGITKGEAGDTINSIKAALGIS